MRACALSSAGKSSGECSQACSVFRRVQSGVQRVPASALRRAAWSVDGGITTRRQSVLLRPPSGKGIVIKGAIGVLMFTDAQSTKQVITAN